VVTNKNGSVTLTQVGLSELQLHCQTMCKQVDPKKMHYCKSQASVNNGSCNQGSHYRNAKRAAALVNPLTVRAIEVLHCSFTSDTHLIVAT